MQIAPVRVLVRVVSIVAAQLALAQEPHADGACERSVGAAVDVAWQGAADARDFITIVPSDARRRPLPGLRVHDARAP